MSGDASVHIKMYGRVQGVFFRAFVADKAGQLGISGFVHNVPGGRAVEVFAEGHKRDLEELLAAVKIGPPNARVDEVETEWSAYSGNYSSFEIR